jgi:hypothetical protein
VAIYIPTDSSEVIPEDIGKMLKLIGGEDLVLDSEGELVFEIGGDLASASGEENIAYAIEARLNTEVGELFAHPEYGTDLYELIGKPNLSNRDKLAEVLILQSFSQDDRIEKITVNSITFETGAMKIDMDFKIRSLDRTINIKKTLTGGGVQIGI